MRRIKVAQFGLGPIGIETLKLAAAHGGMEIVGAVDLDPAKVGRSLSDLLATPGCDEVRVRGTLAQMLDEVAPEVILHTASSSAAATLEQMRPALERGLAVVSSCEELIFPALKAPQLAQEFDRLCRERGARVVAAGVNPGFVMDLLPICLTGVSREVGAIYVERVVDASTRRKPLQAKIGSGLAPDTFRARFAAGQAGHAGLRESLALVAHALGWKLDSVAESGEPVVARAGIKTAFFEVSPGQCCGLHQHCEGLVDGQVRITFDLQMYLGAPHPHDTVVVRGRPPLTVTVQGGVAGDDATVAALINTVPRLIAAVPGLRLPTELPLPAWSNPAGF